jgi:Citrate synthase
MADLTNNEAYINELANVARRKAKIEPELYGKYNVKRGLRNNDGTGVLVGLTEVGEVMSYFMDDGDRIPVDGKLYYQGYEVTDLVNGFYKKRFGYEEIAFLLITGDLPTEQELKDFRALLSSMRPLPEGFTEDMILKAPSPDVMNNLQDQFLLLIPTIPIRILLTLRTLCASALNLSPDSL